MKRCCGFVSVLFVLVLISALLCAGCSLRGTGTTAEHDTGTGADSSDQKIIVTDGLGREIELDKPVESVIISYGLVEKMVYALGAQDSLAAVSSSNLKDKFFTTIKPDIFDLPVLSGQKGINIEEVITLGPELVLLSGGNKGLVDNLETKGIRSFGVVAENLAQLKDTMTELGKAFGKEEKAREFVEYYDDTIRMVGERTASLSEEDKPIVYLCGSSLLSTHAREMYQNDLIRLAGGRNAAGGVEGGKINISPEQLIEWDPNIILAAQYTTEVKLEDILTDKRWQRIDAVANEKVFWFPSNLTPWDYPSAETILGIKWLAQKLHPELFKDVDMVKEADDFYRNFYGVAFSELGGDLTAQNWDR